MVQAVNVDGSFTKQVSDVLDILGTRLYCNTFSNRGKQQNVEVQTFKEAFYVRENEERFHLFCEQLVCYIESCVAAPAKFVDVRK